MSMSRRGHEVSIIDRDAASFIRLDQHFDGAKVVGAGFDRDVLIKAGIETADAFAAVSSGDNSNIIAARVARETFGVENVVARIYDPRRAEIYQRLGIPTVATVGWTAAETLHRMMPERAREEWRDNSGKVALAEFAVDDGWIGTRYSELAKQAGITIAVVNRFGNGMQPTPDLIVQQDDRIHATYDTAKSAEVEAFLAEPPGES